MRFQPRSLSAGMLILLGIVLIGGSFAGVFFLGQRANRTVDVVVATRDIPPLEAVNPADVKLEARPASGVPAGAFTNLTPVVGKYLRFGLVKGQVVVAPMLAETAEQASAYDVALASAAKAAGQDLRAVPLALDQTRGFGLMQKGDRIDILAVIGASGNGKQAVVVASHVLVLDILGGGSTGPQANPTQPGQTQPSSSGVVVLALTPEQAQQVALAQSEGSVMAVLDPLGSASGATPAPMSDSVWTVGTSAPSAQRGK